MNRYVVKVTDKDTGFCYMDFPMLATGKNYTLVTHTEDMLLMCLSSHFAERCYRYGGHTPETPEVKEMCKKIQKECYGNYITHKFIDDNFKFKIVKVKKKHLSDIEFLRGKQ